MISVMLVFQLLYVDGSPAGNVTISERVFAGKAECAEFINKTTTLWVNDDYTFDFLSKDNMRFVGACYTTQEYMELIEN